MLIDTDRKIVHNQERQSRLLRRFKYAEAMMKYIENKTLVLKGCLEDEKLSGSKRLSNA